MVSGDTDRLGGMGRNLSAGARDPVTQISCAKKRIAGILYPEEVQEALLQSPCQEHHRVQEVLMALLMMRNHIMSKKFLKHLLQT